MRFVDRPLVYVAGPYTRPDPVSNTHRAIQVAESLHETGAVTCIVPHTTLLWHVIAPHDDVTHWYEYDLAPLARCDALYRIPGDSSGADAEVAFAVERGIPVFYTIDDLLAWAGDHQ